MYEYDFLNISWDSFQKDTLSLVRKIRELGEFDSILSVARGGLVPTCIIATELDIRKIDVVSIESYKDKEKGDHIIHKHSHLDDERILVIDDLSDSGDTLRLIKTQYPNAVVATVYVKPAGIDAVDLYIKEVKQEKWIVFPWES